MTIQPYKSRGIENEPIPLSITNRIPLSVELSLIILGTGFVAIPIIGWVAAVPLCSGVMGVTKCILYDAKAEAITKRNTYRAEIRRQVELAIDCEKKSRLYSIIGGAVFSGTLLGATYLSNILSESYCSQNEDGTACMLTTRARLTCLVAYAGATAHLVYKYFN